MKNRRRRRENFGILEKHKIEIETTYIQREASERVKSYAAI
jgi:hypothetical protein